MSDFERPKTAVDNPVQNESPLQRVDRRSGETKNNTIDTLARVDELRKETGDRLGKLDEKVAGIVTEVAVTKGQNDVILKTLDKMIDQQVRARDQSGTMRLTSFTASVEVDKARQLTELTERTKWGETWRSNTTKVIAVITALAMLVGAYFFGRGG